MTILRLPLHAIAHGRAGDKGNRSNISVIPYLPQAYLLICEQVSEQAVLQLFSHKGATAVKRYELPLLPALNFVIDNVLEGGVNDGLGLDTHGKTLSSMLLGGVNLDVPVACVPPGSPYLRAQISRS